MLLTGDHTHNTVLWAHCLPTDVCNQLVLVWSVVMELTNSHQRNYLLTFIETEHTPPETEHTPTHTKWGKPHKWTLLKSHGQANWTEGLFIMTGTSYHLQLTAHNQNYEISPSIPSHTMLSILTSLKRPPLYWDHCPYNALPIDPPKETTSLLRPLSTVPTMLSLYWPPYWNTHTRLK